jgi:serine protease inhibitor
MYRPHLDLVVNLTKELTGAPNLVWSPYSVASALGMAAAGARGRTSDEIARALAGAGELDEVAGLLAASAELRDAEIAVANTLWMRLGLTFHEAYQEAVLSWPGGAVRSADFAHDPDGARQKINNEVEQETRGLIADLVPPGAIHAETVALIVNALYLKVAWASAFDAGETAPAPFHAPSGLRDVPTMRQSERLRYAASGGWRLATLSTASQVAMDVLLPDDPDDRPTAGVVSDLLDGASSCKVDLRLPRFRVESEATLGTGGTVPAGPLVQLGVEAAFGVDSADFSGIATEPMFIESAVHKAVLDVDEQGLEGAAATALMMRLTSMDVSRPVPFHVDRPFYVLVRHAPTGALYFFAHIVEP